MKALRRDAMAIFRAALAAADPAAAVRRALEKVDASRYENIYVVGAGKAGAAMARAAEQTLGSHITAGLINVKYGHTVRLRRIELNECGHPIPDEQGVAGARRIAELGANAGAKDLVLCLISGGASALLPMPVDGLTLQQKQHTTSQLLACGANIHEINAVRKHISQIKGGQLARLASPARVITLMLSDVIGDNPDVIGSGPTAPDQSTIAQAQAILRKYKLPALDAYFHETPKPGDPLFRRVQNIVIGSNRQALSAAAAKARELGYRPFLLSSTIEGETRDVARMHAAIAREIQATNQPAKRPVCLISGGETTVTLQGNGKGGRNQEFVLAAAIDIAGLPNTVVLSCGTDGTDGPTDAAGAIADGTTADDSARDYLARNDSYHYFESRRALVKTGPTNTNVMDVRLILTV